jgi:hypothetical protein
VILWQFFPIYVAILFRLLSTILNQLPPTLSAAPQGRSKALLFSIPILFSILSYAGLIIYTFSLLLSQHHDEAGHLTTAALHVLAINFLTIFITLIYWLYVEGGTSTAKAALKWTRRRTGRRRVLWLDRKGGGYAHADHDGFENRKRGVRRTQG